MKSVKRISFLIVSAIIFHSWSACSASASLRVSDSQKKTQKSPGDTDKSDTEKKGATH